MRSQPSTKRFMLKQLLASGLEPKNFAVPVEYGLAQLGAVQVWRNSLSDQAGALARYRFALSLGCTANLPGLYTVAGALRLRRGYAARGGRSDRAHDCGA